MSAPDVDPQDVCNGNVYGGDGYDDLTLKFDTQAIVGALGNVSNGDELVLTVTGKTFDGTSIEGKDCIVIKKKGKNRPSEAIGRVRDGPSFYLHR